MTRDGETLMSRKGSHRRNNRGRGQVTVLRQKPPPSATGSRPDAPALPLARKPEILVTAAAPDELAPLPRNMSLVDPRTPLLGRMRAWMLDVAERWVARNRPLPEQPTIAQLDRLRSDLASAQRRLDRLIG